MTLIMIISKSVFNPSFQQQLPIYTEQSINDMSIEDIVFQEYYNMGKRLLQDNLITIPASQFAKIATIVAYCESNLNTKANKLDQQGIFQITEDTRKACNIPEQYDLSIDEQIKCHEIFLRKCSVKALRSIKTSVDFHALNFAPSRVFQDTLSKVTNKYLAALDFTRDNIITKEDLKIFQKKRVKNNKYIYNLYNNKS